uniref:Uncharacterized protein n=1 Tax=Setaria italica TaxID=4555 RepID=K3Z025_SETIT
MESNGGCGEAPACCVIVVTTTRLPREVRIWWYYSVRWSVVYAAALRRRVPHGSGLIDARARPPPSRAPLSPLGTAAAPCSEAARRLRRQDLPLPLAEAEVLIILHLVVGSLLSGKSPPTRPSWLRGSRSHRTRRCGQLPRVPALPRRCRRPPSSSSPGRQDRRSSRSAAAPPP